MKKALSLILALILVMALFAGCAPADDNSDKPSESSKPDASKPADSSEEEDDGLDEYGLYPAGTYPISPEVIEIHGARPQNGRVAWNDNMQRQWMTEMTNIDLTMDEYPGDVWVEKQGVMLAGGTYPEFFYMANCGKDTQILYGLDGGYLLDLKPYIEAGNMPNFKAIADGDERVYKVFGLEGGESLYALPWLANGLQEACFGINKVWMETVGMPDMPQTLDELNALFQAIIDEDANQNGDPADEIPMSSCYSFYWLPMYVNFGLTTDGIWEAESEGSGIAAWAPLTQNYRDYVIWLADCYEKGYLDARTPGCVINDEAIVADMLGNKVGIGYMANFGGWGQDLGAQLQSFIPVSYNGQDPVWIKAPVGVAGTMTVTDACTNVEALLRYIDFYYTSEGGIQFNQGKEGYSYIWNDDGTWETIFDENEYETWVEFQNTFSIQGNFYWPNAYDPTWDAADARVAQSNIVKGRQALLPYARGAFPPVTLTTEQSEEISVISTDLANWKDTQLVEFVIGDQDPTDDAQWQAFMDGFYARGVETYIEVYQEALDAYYGK